MATLPEAIQAGLGTNVVYGALSEVTCAGNAIADFTEKNFLQLVENPELASVLNHILEHMSNARDLLETGEEHFQKFLNDFRDESPLNYTILASQLKEHELIKKLQQVSGMSAEEIAKANSRNNVH